MADGNFFQEEKLSIIGHTFRYTSNDSIKLYIDSDYVYVGQRVDRDNGGIIDL